MEFFSSINCIKIGTMGCMICRWLRRWFIGFIGIKVVLLMSFSWSQQEDVLSIENVWETNFIVCRIEKYASSWTERFLFIVRCNLTGYNRAFTFITPSGLVHRLSRIPPPHCSVGSVDDVLSCWDSSHLSMTYAIDNIYIYIYIRDATIYCL